MDRINELLGKAHSLWRGGDEKQMLIYLKEALDISVSVGDVVKQIEILNEYAGALRVNGYYDDAIANIDRALTLVDNLVGRDNVNYATTLMNKANIYREKKDYSTAQTLMLQAKDMFDRLNDKSYSYVGLINNLSLIYQETMQYQKAEALQLEAISILKNDPKYAVPLAISYNNLYEIQKKLGNTQNALENLNFAREILLKNVGENHPMYCAVLNNMADFHVQNKEYDKALNFYSQSLTVIEKCYGADSSAYKVVKSNYDFVQNLINTLI